MPEFLGRPNLPNQLANTLVQLAAHEMDPIAEGIQNLAKSLGSALGEMGVAKRKEAHETKMKGMDIDARKEENRVGLLTELVKNDQIVKSLLEKPMSSGDAQALLGPGAKTQERMIMDDFGPGKKKNPAAAGGIESEDLGLPGGFTVTKKPEKKDTNRWVTVDNKLTATFPALKGIEGKDISTAQYLNLSRAGEMAARHKGVMDDKLWARAVSLANNDMEFVQASMDGDEAKIAEIIDRKKRLVLKTGGRVGASAGASKRKELGSIIADAFEKGITQ